MRISDWSSDVCSSDLIYEVTNEGGAFQPLRQGITRILPDPLMQVLAFGWAFASFLQGVTGFGVPIAVCAPLLVGIGVRPLFAVIRSEERRVGEECVSMCRSGL